MVTGEEMKIFKVLGSVTLARSHPTYRGGQFRIVQAAGDELLSRPESAEPDMLVAWDDRGAGIGSLVAVSDGGEAAQAFRPELKPVDAYVSAILDSVIIDPETIKQLG